MTGREDGPELVKVAPLLGKDEIVKRLDIWVTDKLIKENNV